MQTAKLKRTAIAVAVAGLTAGGSFYLGQHWVPPAHAESTAMTNAPNAAAPAAAVSRVRPDFSAIVEQYGQSVVNISVDRTVKASLDRSPFQDMDPDSPLFEFFRRFRGPMPGGEVPDRAMGSGFIVGADGIILTNAHVVADAREVTVKLTDKREFPAKVVGIDRATDVAILRIDAKGLPTVKLGDPDKTRVGDWVLAIGSPFGFENSATAGIVSAKSRALPDEGYVSFIQTDVAVNPGNSGGPLFNMNGEVIGINSQIYSRSGGYQGLSFAIPIGVAMGVEQQILSNGKVTRGHLGVSIQEVNQQLADSFGLKKPEGVLVSSVEKGSPAEKAGIVPGDVILSFNGKRIGRVSDLPPRVAELKPGSKSSLELWHQGAKREVEVSVGELKSASASAASSEGADQGRLGVAVRPLTPEERRQADVPNGLLVEDVAGAAARAGIEPGDVILSLNGVSVGSAAQLRGLLEKAGKHVALLVYRDNARIFVPINLG
ncbi:MAG: DegQ family serine endoprotease [Rhodocyclaceae bacterium]|jgi:serine protease Do|nr:DegQ family serine endoprotease [Rhodocyclaceae bacterium]MCO5097255.1 DegQ family serine endoprotease [Rhodocyclaceae bacterium]